MCSGDQMWYNGHRNCGTYFAIALQNFFTERFLQKYNQEDIKVKKKFYVLFLIAALMMTFCFTACSKNEEAPAAEPEETIEEEAVNEEAEEPAEEPAVDGSAYGYGGSDPIEAAVYKYMAEEVSKNYGEADVHIPTVNIVNEDLTSEDEILVYGDFWIENYNIDGDTLKCVSGGNHPGVIHMSKDYVVTAFDQVADGGDFESSAKELFGDYFDAFMAVYGDSDARAELRKATVTDYVNLNGLDVTQFQDEGWDPIEIFK